jgi:crossover junction endodeoxyribonuclease RuvC
MRVMGIDPGLDGATAVVDDVGGLHVDCVPNRAVETEGRGRQQLLGPLYNGVKSLGVAVEIAFIERVNAMPKQGLSSAFKFGETLGAVKMACAAAGVAWETVEPRAWMREFGLKGKDNERALALALQHFPGDGVYFEPARGFLTKAAAVGMADAALIALYGYRYLRRV